MQILPADQTTCKRGQEYCILLYSEKKLNYLQNIGYIGEQLDLYLASMNIGALWFGIGKVEETTYHGLVKSTGNCKSFTVLITPLIMDLAKMPI